MILNMFSILLFLLIIILFIQFNSRLDKLETKLNNKIAAETDDNVTPSTDEDSFKNPQLIERKSEFIPGNDNVSKFIDWLQIEWPLKIGSLLILLALGWFLQFAFASNWIDSVGRIFLGFLIGIIFATFAHFRIKKYQYQGTVLAALGAGLELITLYAATNIYSFFSPSTALGVVFVVIFYLSIASYIYNQPPLAVLGLVTGSFIPYLITSASADFLLFLGYQLVLTTGIVWLTAITKWSYLIFLSLILIFFHSAVFILSGSSLAYSKIDLAFFVFFFATLFYLANLIKIVVSRKITEIETATIFTNALFVIFWISIVASEELRSYLLLFCSSFFILGAFVTFTLTRISKIVYIYASVSVIFVAIAAVFELEGSYLIYALSLIIFFYSLMTDLLFNRRKDALTLSTTMIIPVIMSFRTIYEKWSGSLFQENFFILLMISSIWPAYMYYFKKIKPAQYPIEAEKSYIAIYGYLTTIFSFTLIWKISQLVFASDTYARFIVLTIYTIIGVFIYITGKLKNNTYAHSLGGVIMLFVAARLLFAETIQMETAGKIITYFIVGIVFISTIFFENLKFSSKK